MKNKCDECKETFCYEKDIEELDRLSYQIKETLASASVEDVKHSKWGYTQRLVDNDVRQRLINYKWVLDRVKERTRKGLGVCLCERDIERLKNKVYSNVGKARVEHRKDLRIDRSNFNQWVAENPEVVGREPWERIAYQVCEEIGFTLDITRDYSKNLVVDITMNRIDCTVSMVLDIYKRICDIEFGYTFEDLCDLLEVDYDSKHIDCQIELNDTELIEKCKLDYQLLIEKYDCDIPFRDYLILISDCNFNYDMITTLYECGVDLAYDENTECAEIITDTQRYNLCDLDVNFGESTICDPEDYEQTKCEVAHAITIDSLCADGNFISRIEALIDILGVEHFTDLLDGHTETEICSSCPGQTVGECIDTLS